MSFNITGKFVKVWHCEVFDKYVKLDLSTSKKNQDGTYTNSSWKSCRAVGKAFEVAKGLNKGDTINVLSGLLGKRKYEDKWYDDVVIFEIEVVRKGENQLGGFEQTSDPALSEDLPF